MLSRIKISFIKAIRKLSELWKQNRRKWIISGLIWIATFFISLVISVFLGVEILLILLLLTYVIALVLHRKGLGTLAIKQFWGRIRGMIVFSLLPALLETIRELIISPSVPVVIELAFSILFIVLIWVAFDKIMRPFIPKK